MLVCIFQENLYYIGNLGIVVVNLVCLDEGRSLYTVIIVTTTRVFNLVLFVFVCRHKVIPPRLLHTIFACFFMKINAYKCLPVFSSNQQLKYSTLKKKVEELIK